MIATVAARPSPAIIFDKGRPPPERRTPPQAKNSRVFWSDAKVPLPFPVAAQLSWRRSIQTLSRQRRKRLEERSVFTLIRQDSWRYNGRSAAKQIIMYNNVISIGRCTVDALLAKPLHGLMQLADRSPEFTIRPLRRRPSEPGQAALGKAVRTLLASCHCLTAFASCCFP